MNTIRHNSLAKCAFRLVLIMLSLLLSASQAFSLSPSDLVVVYNINMEASKTVAEYYAKKRGVPISNLVGVDAPSSERMCRSDFEKGLIPPVRAMVERLKKDGKDPAILLVHGIPLVVKGPARKKPDETFMALVGKKVEEYKELVLQLIAELDLLTGSDDSTLATSDPLKSTCSTKDVLKIAGESFARGLQYLETSKTSINDNDVRARISSLLIRLAGTSTAAKAFIGIMSKQEEKNREMFKSQELLKWDAILRREMNERSFLGELPENALETATTVRFIDGVLGELRFWYELKTKYEDGRTSASVDSELTLILAGPYQHAGWLPNPFHDRYKRMAFVRKIRERTIKVARLDGPTPELAKRLVDDAVETENIGLNGIFYIDARGLTNNGSTGSYAWFDQHLINLYNIVRDEASMEVVIDKGQDLFPVGACPNAALYCGWYSLRNYVDSFTWQKGAVAFHVASAEASTLRNNLSNVWCKRMIEKGVSATLGPVQEPYLLSFPLPDHFFPLLMTGKLPLLDVYFRTIPYVSWRQILIGDPLYTPFKKNPAIRLPKKTETKAPQGSKPVEQQGK